MSRRAALGALGTPLGMLGIPLVRAFAQGVSSRGVKAQPRGKPSGLPFDANFVDIAAQAGLRTPLLYGGPEKKTYIVETVGCGCAFFDYDNDGWLDIFLLDGTRLEGVPEGATNRLYKNNRDGTFTDVTEKAGLRKTGWSSAVTVGDFNNDGFEDLFITYWGQNILYRNNGDGTFYRCHGEGRHGRDSEEMEFGLRVRRLRSRWPPGPGDRELSRPGPGAYS